MIKLTFTPDVVMASDVLPSQLVAAVRVLHAHAPIAEILADLKDVPTNRFLYRITTAEPVPRVWKQNLIIDGSVARMTFDVADYWEEHEFIPHRDVRAIVISLLKKYPTLTRIKYDGV